MSGFMVLAVVYLLGAAMTLLAVRRVPLPSAWACFAMAVMVTVWPIPFAVGLMSSSGVDRMDFETDFADPKLEEQGVWVDYEHNGFVVEGARVKIGRLNNKAFQKKLDALMKPYRNLPRGKEIPADKQTELTCQAYVGTILMGWEGFTTGGKPQPFNEKAAYQMLISRVDFRNSITTLALREDTFKR